MLERPLHPLDVVAAPTNVHIPVLRVLHWEPEPIAVVVAFPPAALLAEVASPNADSHILIVEQSTIQLKKVNQMLDVHDLQPVTIRFVEETLQDIEIIELVNQGHINATVLDSHKAERWLKVMDNILLHDQAPIRVDGKIAWAMRKNSPHLQSFVNQYLRKTIKIRNQKSPS